MLRKGCRDEGYPQCLLCTPNIRMSKPLRLAMPHTAGFIDALREAFGAPQIDQAIRAGIDGQPTFWACENGREIGTRATPPGASYTADQCLAATLPKQPKDNP